MTRMTKTERIAREGLMKNLIHLHRDGWISSVIEEEIPISIGRSRGSIARWGRDIRAGSTVCWPHGRR